MKYKLKLTSVGCPLIKKMLSATPDHLRRHGRHRVVRDSFVLRSDNLGQKVVRGAGLTLLGIALRTLVTLGSVSVLARLLSPSDFGYIAMATIVTEFAALFANFGFSSVLIQKRVITRLQIDTVFWASVAVGLSLTATGFVLSYFAIGIFNEPTAGQLIRLLSVNFAIEALIVVHGALMHRLMRFQADFWIQFIGIVTRAVTAVVLAWHGYGVWSLAIGALAGSVLRSFLMILVIPYWPRVKFNFSYLRSTWKTNASYFAGGFLFYANSNVDLLLIGRALGASALGYYQTARSLTDEVRYRIAVPLQRVLFPAFSALQENTRSLQATVLRSGRLLAAIVFPLGVGIAAIADELVPILYGEQWLAMIPILKLLGVSTAVKASTMTATALFNATGRVGLALRYNIIGSVIVLALISIASPWGILPVACAVALSSLYSIFIYRIGLGLIGLAWTSVWSMLAPSVFASAIMWIAIEIARVMLEDHLKGVQATLLLHVALGVITYLLVLVLASPSYVNEFRAVFAKIRPAW